jgi:predicted RND superfamily exporter protein
VGLTFVLVCFAFCYVGFSKIQSNTEDVLQWLPDQSDAREKYDFFTSKFGSDDFLIVTWQDCTVDDPRLASFTKHVRDHDSDALIQKVTNGTEVVQRLSSDMKLTRASVLGRLRGVFFGTENPELTCALIELSSHGTANRVGSMQLVWDAIDADPKLNRQDVTMGGYPYIATFIDKQLSNSFRSFLVPSVILSTLIALFCLRNLVLTLIVFVTSVGAAATSIAFIPICDMKYGGLMSIIPALVFVLATSGSIHLIRYSLEAIGDPRKLLKIGWRPCTVSAATTSVGMLSLLRSDFPAIRNFGLFCATGVGFALAFQLVLVPCLLGRFGKAGLHKLSVRSERSSFWARLMDRVRCHKFSVAAACVLVMILGGIGLNRLKAEVEVEKLFRPGSDILNSIADLESRLAPMDQTELLVVFDEPDPESFPDRAILVKRIQFAVAKLPEVKVIYSLVNFLPT